jgi:hypothetical protein
MQMHVGEWASRTGTQLVLESPCFSGEGESQAVGIRGIEAELHLPHPLGAPPASLAWGVHAE